MTPYPDDLDRQPTRDEIDRMEGPVLLEFGASWCGGCRTFGTPGGSRAVWGMFAGSVPRSRS